jgi:eukaryotic-like serine/threonine-protein kinase
MIDQTIAHFRIVERLGAGGMGVVYKAVDTRLDRPVALKFLPDDMAHDAQALERFRREAQAASALNHPGICTIYDIGEQDNRPFIAMEFIDGETLRQHIHGQPLDVHEILALGIQIADALDVAHTGGIVHRDIKPSNVFVTKRGQAKVLDFGLAKLAAKELASLDSEDPSSKGSHDSISVVGVINGTPAYMSPEQVRGDDLDARTDIFALGLLLYEMATGRQALGARTGGAIIEAILTRTPPPVQSVNPQVPSQLEEIISKCLQKDREKRYQTAAEVRGELQQLKRVTDTGQVTVTIAPAPRGVRWKVIAAAAAAVVVLLGVGGWLYMGRAPALNQSDTIVLADFINKTGDPIFDDTLRQGLAAQLQQSPFLSLVSDQRIQQTLRLMGRSPDTKLSPAIAGEVCLRSGSKAYLGGSIAAMGSEYVIGVSAVNCQSGDYLAQEQATANGKESVLKALGAVSTALRQKLGESLKSVHKLDTPIEQATTSSLEALQAFSLGRQTMAGKGDYTGAVPLFQRSIDLDSNFAMAYALLGTTYHNLGEKMLAAQSTRKAYELRGRVSEWEKFYIESHYYHFVTDDLEKARQAYELWAQIYPREQVPRNNMGEIDQSLGQHEKALKEYEAALKLGPADNLSYANMVVANIHLNRLAEAQRIAQEAQAKGLDSGAIRLYLYQVAFLRQDAEGMAQQASWAAGKTGVENLMLNLQAGTAAYAGKLGEARELSKQAETSASRAQESEMAAGCAAAAALWEALYGNRAEAKERVYGTLALSNGRDAQYVAALALALNGDSDGARVLADDLEKRFPEDTIVRFNYLPTLRAQLWLNSAASANAIESLAVAAPYELGIPGSSTFWTNLYPVYVRGQAFLAAHQGTQAAAEFQKILAWPGVAVNEPIGVLAHLGLARSYAQAGDATKARMAYQMFFALWKEADADIPVLNQAKGEYAELQ